MEKNPVSHGLNATSLKCFRLFLYRIRRILNILLKSIHPFSAMYVIDTPPHLVWKVPKRLVRRELSWKSVHPLVRNIADIVDPEFIKILYPMGLNTTFPKCCILFLAPYCTHPDNFIKIIWSIFRNVINSHGFPRWNAKKFFIQEVKNSISKIFQIVHCAMSELSWKPHENPSMQTGKQTKKDENITFRRSAEVVICKYKRTSIVITNTVMIVIGFTIMIIIIFCILHAFIPFCARNTAHLKSWRTTQSNPLVLQ